MSSYPNSSRCWVGTDTVHWPKIPSPAEIELPTESRSTGSQHHILKREITGRDEFMYRLPDNLFTETLGTENLMFSVDQKYVLNILCQNILKHAIWNYKNSYCILVFLLNFIEDGMQDKSIWEQDPRAYIWAQERCEWGVKRAPQWATS